MEKGGNEPPRSARNADGIRLFVVAIGAGF
jgi:hypothetical protein